MRVSTTSLATVARVLNPSYTRQHPSSFEAVWLSLSDSVRIINRSIGPWRLFTRSHGNNISFRRSRKRAQPLISIIRNFCWCWTETYFSSLWEVSPYPALLSIYSFARQWFLIFLMLTRRIRETCKQLAYVLQLLQLKRIYISQIGHL